MTRLEEQLSVLISKMDQQSEQLQQLTKIQSERVDSIVHRLDETDKQIDAIAGDLDSVKSAVHGHLEEVEGSFTNLKGAQDELGERQKVLKAELRDELLHELTASMKSTLRATAPPFIPSTENPGDGGGRATPTVHVSADHGVDSAGRDGSTPGSGGSGTGQGAATDATTEERGSTWTHGGGSAAVATPSSSQLPLTAN